MKSKYSSIIFFGLLGFFVLGVIVCVFYLLSVTGEEEEGNDLKISLDEEKEIVYSKLDAYNNQIQDSILSVRDENVKVNLSRLWKNKVNSKANSDTLQNLFDEAMSNEITTKTAEPTSKPQPETKIVYVERPRSKPIVAQAPEPEPMEYERKSGFYSSFDDDSNVGGESSSRIKAVIHGEQKVQTNTTVKLRITQDITLNGFTIPRGTFVSGKVQLNDQRVVISFQNINYKGKLYPFNYSAYDQDGWEGILVADLIINDVSQDVVTELINETQTQTRVNIPVIGGVTFNTAKKVNNEVSAKLVSDYPVILKSN